MTSFLNNLGNWPNDCNNQRAYLQNLETNLQNLELYLTENTAQVVLLSQTTEPTQEQWEDAYTDQTGNALPIPATTQLLWFNTAQDTFGGVFGTIPGSVTVYRREHLYPKNSIVHYSMSALATSVTGVTSSLYENFSNLPSITFTNYVPCRVVMEFSITTQITAGTGTWGVDFLFDGIKVGSQYHSILANSGLQNLDYSGNLTTAIMLNDILPGTHLVRPMWGVTNSPASPPTLAIGGGTRGARILTVKAIAQ